MDNRIYKEVVINKLNNLLDTKKINRNFLSIFDNYYKELSDSARLDMLALVAISYDKIDNISFSERLQFVDGMSKYIEFTSFLDTIPNEVQDVESKKNMVMDVLSMDFDFGVVPIMYQEGVNAAALMIDGKKKKVKSRHLRVIK